MTKRIFALLLCLVMCLSLIPTSAFADQEIPEEPAVEEPAEETTEELAEQPVEEPAEELAEEPIEEPTEEPAEESVEDPAEEPVEEPAEKPAEEPAEEPAEKPVEEPAEEDFEDPFIPVEEADDSVSDKPTFYRYDPADGEAQPVAGTISVNNDYTASISTGGAVIYYRFVPSDTNVYYFTASSQYDTYGYLYDADWNLITGDDDDGTDYNFLIRELLYSGRTYYLGVAFYDEARTGSIPFSVKKLQNGWNEIGGEQYYYVDGNPVNGVYAIDGVKYGFDHDGRLIRNGSVRHTDGEVYYADADGKIVVKKGWIKTPGGDWYYALDDSGKLAIGFQTIGSAEYYFRDSGRMVSGGVCEIYDSATDSYKNYYFANSGAVDKTAGWKKNSDGSYCYVKSDGQAVCGDWYKVGSTWYYFDWDGIMYADGGYRIYENGSEKIYFFKSSGAWDNTAGWKKNSNGDYWYVGSSGQCVTGWQTIGGSKYYFDTYDGLMYAGGQYEIDGQKYFFTDSGTLGTKGWNKCVRTETWTDENGKKHSQTYTYWYYLGDDNLPVKGWQKIGSATYYFESYDGRMYSGGVYSIEDKYYFFAESGARAGTGWQKQIYKFTDSSGKQQTHTEWYYTKDGVIQTGWQKIDGKWYFFTEWGYMYSDGVYEISGKKYFFDKSGAMGTGWCKRTSSGTTSGGSKTSGTDWYYADGSGVIQTGWQTISGKKYYFSDWGWMYSDGLYTIGDKQYFFTSSGALAGAGWQSVKYNYNGKDYTTWFYTNADGTAIRGWKKIGSTWYYFGISMYAGDLFMVDGKWEYFKPNGAWVATGSSTAWRRSGNNMRYYENGKMVTGWKKIGDEYFYFESNGNMKTGWVKSSGKWYYCAPSMVYSGVYRIDGKDYFFDNSGAMVSSTGWYKNSFTRDGLSYINWYYVESGGVLATGWRTISGKQYYFNPSMYSNGGYQIGDRIYYFDANGAYTGENHSVN